MHKVALDSRASHMLLIWYASLHVSTEFDTLIFCFHVSVLDKVTKFIFENIYCNLKHSTLLHIRSIPNLCFDTMFGKAGNMVVISVDNNKETCSFDICSALMPARLLPRRPLYRSLYKSELSCLLAAILAFLCGVNTSLLLLHSKPGSLQSSGIDSKQHVPASHKINS